MQPLNDVLPALRREILAALDREDGLPNGARLQAERVVVSLAFSVRNGTGDSGPLVLVHSAPSENVESAGQGGGQFGRAQAHSLTIEFRVGTGLPSANSPMPQPTQEATAPNAPGPSAPGPDQVAEALVSIFGAPGFDSSARATVFREALSGLSDDQARAIVDSMRGMPTPGITPAAARARGLISRLLEGSPAGAARSREVLAEVFYRHSVQSLIRLVREKWKTQEHWLDEPVQRPNPGKGSGR